MSGSWYTTQLDYVFYWYGLAFVLLAAVCLGRNRCSDQQQLPWRWLGWFGLLHGANEWLEMLSITLDDNSTFRAARLGVMAVSFVPLMEFGRRGAYTQSLRIPTIWLPAAVLVTGLGVLDGMAGLNAAFRYTLGLPAGLLAGWVLWREARRSDSASTWPLRWAGLTLMVYGVTTGLIVPRASFFPASVLNQESFLAAAGFPVQLLRGLCAVGCAWGVYLLGRAERAQDDDPVWFRRRLIPTILVLLTVIGWSAAEWRSRIVGHQVRQELVAQADAMARALDPTGLKALSFTAADKNNPQFHRLRDQITAYGQTWPNARRFQLLARRDDHMVFGIDLRFGKGQERQQPAEPGETCRDVPAGLHRIDELHRLTSQGKDAGRWGPLLSAFASVCDPATGDVLAVVALEIDGVEWKTAVGEQRLIVILTIMAISLIVLGSSVVLRRRAHCVRENRRWLRYTEACVTTVLGVVVSAMAGIGFQDWEARTQQEVFYRLADTQASRVIETLHDLHDGRPSILGRIGDASAQRPLEILLQQTSRSAGPGSLAPAVELYQLTRGQSPELVASSDGEESRWKACQSPVLGESEGFSAVYPLFAFDKAYAVVVRSESVHLDAHPAWTAGAAFLVGLALTAVLATCVLLLTRRGIEMESMIQARTAQLRHSEARVRAITDAACDAILMIDSQGRISYWNPVATEIFGFTPAEAIGSDLHGLLVPDRYHAVCRKGLLEFARSGRGAAVGKTLELRACRKDGQEIEVALSLSAIRIDDEWHGIGILRDVTERNRMEEELRRAKVELERHVAALESTNQALEASNHAAQSATRAKSEFLANMSHEIRTPITAILGYADVMIDENYGRATQERALIIKRNGLHLLELLNDILDLSTVESGRMEFEQARCSPWELLTDVVSLMRVRADAKQLKVHTEAVGLLPETIHTAPLRLRQILVNLLGNAIKFTEHGEVRVTTRLNTVAGPTRLCFEVSDTGIGMNEEQMARLFQAFSQADGSSTRRFGGTGLGLAISKRLIEALGGDIEVTSSPGHGTTFLVTIDPGPLDGIRLVPPEKQLIAGATVTSSATKTELHSRILLVEDGLDNQRLIRILLSKAGAHVETAANGKLAVELVERSFAAGETFDVILMDMQMPIMDGYIATRELRAKGYTGPILALTAHAMSEDRQRCLDAGCDDYMTKPIDRKRLITAVAQWAEHGKTRTPSTSSALSLPG